MTLMIRTVAIFRLRRMHEMLSIFCRCLRCLSVCQYLCSVASIGGGVCSVRFMPCEQGHLVQPLSNAFDLLFLSYTMFAGGL